MRNVLVGVVARAVLLWMLVTVSLYLFSLALGFEADNGLRTVCCLVSALVVGVPGFVLWLER